MVMNTTQGRVEETSNKRNSTGYSRYSTQLNRMMNSYHEGMIKYRGHDRKCNANFADRKKRHFPQALLHKGSCSSNFP